jgi:alpha-L-rhamnosidase
MKSLFLYLLVFVFAASGIAQKLVVINPRCEYRQNPLGVDEAKPKFSWELQSTGR